jgi:hypothetical protein
MTGLPPTLRENPPIPFVLKAKKVENTDKAVDKTEHIWLEFFIVPSYLTPSIQDLFHNTWLALSATSIYCL